MSETVVIVGASHASVQAIDTLRREGHDGSHRPGRRRAPPALQPARRCPRSSCRASSSVTGCCCAARSSTSRRGSRRGSARASPRSTGRDRRLRLADGDELRLRQAAAVRRQPAPRARRARLRPAAASTTCARLPTSRQSGPTCRVPGASWWSGPVTSGSRRLRARGISGSKSRCSRWPTGPMNRVVAPELSAFYMRRHEREGVRIHCNTSVTAFEGDGRVGRRRLRRRKISRGPRDRRRRHPAGRRARRRGGHPLRERRLGGRAVPDFGRERLRCGRLHQSPERPLRAPRAPRVGGQRRRAGARRPPPTCAARARATRTCRGSGRTSTTSSCRLPACRRDTTRPSCEATPTPGSFALYYLARGELLAVDAVNSPQRLHDRQEVDRGAQAPRSREARRHHRRPEDDLRLHVTKNNKGAGSSLVSDDVSRAWLATLGKWTGGLSPQAFGGAWLERAGAPGERSGTAGGDRPTAMQKSIALAQFTGTAIRGRTNARRRPRARLMRTALPIRRGRSSRSTCSRSRSSRRPTLPAKP